MKPLCLALLSITLGAHAETVAIVGADAWTNAADAPVKNATIVVADGRIASVGAGAPAPPGARVVQAAGKIVTPGLDAAATQIGLVELASAADTDDRAISSGILGAAFDVSLGVDANSLTIQQARAAGVARALVFPGAAGNGIFAGQGARLYLAGRSNIVSQARVALFVTAGGGAAHAAGGSRAAVWGLLRNALEEARQARTGLSPFKPRDQVQNHLELEALKAVLERHVPLAVFANREADIRQAIAIAQDFNVSMVIVGGAEAWRAADGLAAHHVAVIVDPLDELPVNFDSIGARRDNAALLARAGVTFSFLVSGQGIYLSYDVGPALREGAGIAVANGLPYADALRAITQSAGRIWGEPASSKYAMLVPGAPADLVLWDGDPLEPSSAPALVMLGGKEVSLQTRQTLLRDRYRPERAPPAPAAR
jgi:imidazolonepropionase-like amidohydrolase